MIRTWSLKEINSNLEVSGRERVASIDDLRRVMPEYRAPKPAFSRTRATKLKRINSVLNGGQ